MNSSLIQLNEYALHNPENILTWFTPIFNLLLELQSHWFSFESEDQQVCLLENLVFLLGMDKSVMEQQMRMQIRQVILNDHCEFVAQEMLKQKKQWQVPPYIETTLLTITNSMVTLASTPLFLDIINDQKEFAIVNQFTTPNNKPKKQNEPIVRWHIPKHFEFTLSKQYSDFINQITNRIVFLFNKTKEVLNNKSSSNINPYNYYYNWELLLKVLEILISKIPPTSLLISSEFIMFLSTNVITLAPDRLASFY